ncbi:MAG: hypothetical protein CMK78_08260 [Pseudomonadales bacterium]|nr:hypothetical protein [Pseudomonadales bacterium]
MDYSAIFGSRAISYLGASERYPAIREQEIARFVDLLCLKPGETFLDIPCGNGLVSERIAPTVRYLGLDPAATFVDHCRNRNKPVVQSSMRCTGLPSGSVDVIGSLTGIHHEADRLTLYAEWFRLLRPGGRLVIADVACGGEVDRFLNEFVNEWNSEGHDGNFLCEQDVQLVKQSGFANVLFSQLNHDWQASTEIEMYDFMLALFGLDKQPSLAATQEAWRHLGWSKDREVCRLPWSLSVISAQKPEVATFE